ncbi:acyl-CoA reductase-like NAD-dependent aldehyde dehydrogenase [Micromonospora sp. H404/HB375]|nr:acyl-CoA reductase-like NAD-dependent aldehyde dehydrogenase [Micromonospora sp. H404/HB375]
MNMSNTVADVTGLFIGGTWRPSSGTDRFTVTSPATGEVLWNLAEAVDTDVDDAFAAAQAAFERHQGVSPYQRADWCERIADQLEARREPLARAISLEQGKPLAEALGEAGSAVEGFRLAAQEARALRGDTIPTHDTRKRVFTHRRPCGVYAVITPWNFPLNIPVEYLGPAIASGNTVVWKPAPTTAGTAVLLARCIEAAEVPMGIVNLLTGRRPELGRTMVTHRLAIGVGFTGSSAVGAEIARIAYDKRKILELGGNGPVIVLREADIALAAQQSAAAAYANSGQSCAAAGRILCESSVYDDFVAALAVEAARVVVGPPLAAATTMGPCHTRAVYDQTQAHIDESLAGGATLAFGDGSVPGAATDLFRPPAVLAGVPRHARVNIEETFGPLAAVIRVDGDADVLATAAMSRFGLSSAIFSENYPRAIRLAERLNNGQVVLNDTSNYWELHMPFGGWPGSDSGSGRLGVREALLGMTEVQSISVHLREVQ